MPLKLDGMDELIAKVNRLANASVLKEKALDVGAEHMRKKIAENTPRSKLNKEHAADHIVVAKKLGQRQIGPAHGYFYLRYPEFGTSTQPAQGFMSKTFHAESDKTRDLMRDVLKDGLNL